MHVQNYSFCVPTDVQFRGKSQPRSVEYYCMQTYECQPTRTSRRAYLGTRHRDFLCKISVHLSDQSIYISISPASHEHDRKSLPPRCLMPNSTVRTQTHVQCELYVHPGLESPQRHMFERHAIDTPGLPQRSSRSRYVDRYYMCPVPNSSEQGGFPKLLP